MIRHGHSPSKRMRSLVAPRKKERGMKKMLDEILGNLRHAFGVDVTKKDPTFWEQAKDACLVVVAYVGAFFGCLFNAIVAACSAFKESWDQDLSTA